MVSSVNKLKEGRVLAGDLDDDGKGGGSVGETLWNG